MADAFGSVVGVGSLIGITAKFLDAATLIVTGQGCRATVPVPDTTNCCLITWNLHDGSDGVRTMFYPINTILDGIVAGDSKSNYRATFTFTSSLCEFHAQSSSTNADIPVAFFHLM